MSASFGVGLNLKGLLVDGFGLDFASDENVEVGDIVVSVDGQTALQSTVEALLEGEAGTPCTIVFFSSKRRATYTTNLRRKEKEIAAPSPPPKFETRTTNEIRTIRPISPAREKEDPKSSLDQGTQTRIETAPSNTKLAPRNENITPPQGKNSNFSVRSLSPLSLRVSPPSLKNSTADPGQENTLSIEPRRTQPIDAPLPLFLRADYGKTERYLTHEDFETSKIPNRQSIRPPPWDNFERDDSVRGEVRADVLPRAVSVIPHPTPKNGSDFSRHISAEAPTWMGPKSNIQESQRPQPQFFLGQNSQGPRRPPDTLGIQTSQIFRAQSPTSPHPPTLLPLPLSPPKIHQIEPRGNISSPETLSQKNILKIQNEKIQHLENMLQTQNEKNLFLTKTVADFHLNSGGGAPPAGTLSDLDRAYSRQMKLEHELESRRHEISQLREDLEISLKNAKGLHLHNDSLLVELKNLKKKATVQEGVVAIPKIDLEKKIKNFEKEIWELTDLKNGHERKIEEMGRELENNFSQKQQQFSKLKELGEKYEETRNTNAILTEQAAALKTQVSVLKEQITSLSGQNSLLLSHVSNLEMNDSYRRNEESPLYVSALKEVTTMRDQNRVLSEQNKMLILQMQELRAAIAVPTQLRSQRGGNSASLSENPETDDPIVDTLTSPSRSSQVVDLLVF